MWPFPHCLQAQDSVFPRNGQARTFRSTADSEGVLVSVQLLGADSSPPVSSSFPSFPQICAFAVSRSTATMIMCAGRAHPAALHPAAAASMIIECAGCAKPILDKFLLNVLERTWHAECVRCYDCRGNLTDKCFSREGKLFCRNDFFR